MRILFRVFGYTARYPWMAVATMFCAVTGTLMVAVFPAVTQRVVDVVLRQHHPEKLMPLIVIGLAAFFAQDLLNALRILLNNHFEQRVIFDLRSDLYARIQMLPLPWFDNRATGDIMTRLVEDVTNVERVLIDGIEQGTVALLQMRRSRPFLFWPPEPWSTRSLPGNATAPRARRPPRSTPSSTTTSTGSARSRPTRPRSVSTPASMRQATPFARPP